MKTKTIFLICLFIGIGFTRLTAQTDVYKFYDTGGLMPITCDGNDIELLSYTADFTWLSHSQQGKWKWVKVVACNWTATSSSGEEFKANEHDPAIEILDAAGNRIQEKGTWRIVLNGNWGSHYRITWAYTITVDPNDPNNLLWDFSLLEAKCH
jgi:hypothetical protein